MEKLVKIRKAYGGFDISGFDRHKCYECDKMSDYLEMKMCG